jgi:hypothetical protein
VPAPLGTAQGSVSISGVQSFFNNSSVDLTVHAVALPANNTYTLSLSGVNPPLEMGQSAIDFSGFVDELTTNGMRTVPAPFDQTFLLPGGQTFSFGGGTVVLDAQAAIVPEPSTLTLLGLGTLGMLCYGWRYRKRA